MAAHALFVVFDGIALGSSRRHAGMAICIDILYDFVLDCISVCIDFFAEVKGVLWSWSPCVYDGQLQNMIFKYCETVSDP